PGEGQDGVVPQPVLEVGEGSRSEGVEEPAHPGEQDGGCRLGTGRCQLRRPRGVTDPSCERVERIRAQPVATASAICLDVRSLDEPGFAQLVEVAAQGGRCGADTAGPPRTWPRAPRLGLA